MRYSLHPLIYDSSLKCIALRGIITNIAFKRVFKGAKCLHGEHNSIVHLLIVSNPWPPHGKSGWIGERLNHDKRRQRICKLPEANQKRKRNHCTNAGTNDWQEKLSGALNGKFTISNDFKKSKIYNFKPVGFRDLSRYRILPRIFA